MLLQTFSVKGDGRVWPGTGRGRQDGEGEKEKVVEANVAGAG